MEQKDVEFLIRQVKRISELHSSFSRDFYSEVSSNYNLKKMSIDDAFDGNLYSLDFLDYLDRYVTKINFFTSLDTAVEELGETSFADFRTRVKQKDSVLNKLLYYRSTKESENGPLPIQKCLNDLFGLRFIIPEFDYEDPCMLRAFRALSNDHVIWRSYYRNKEKYHGYHVYFRSDSNKFLPWELQLWSNKDADANEEAHKEHKSKRAYISWPEEYKKSEKAKSLKLRRNA